MPTTTITPIPYNGGTITLKNRADMTYVHMGAGKFVMLYSQRAPALTYAYVVNITGLNTATPAAANGPQFAFPNTNGQVRAWKMAENRILVLLGNDLRVLELDGSDNITMRAAALTGYYSAAYLWLNSSGVNNGEINDLGNMIHAHQLRDNEMQVFRRGNMATNQMAGATNWFVTKVVFNPTADTLTSSASITTMTPPSGQNGYTRLQVKDIPNSTDKIVSVVGADNNASYSRMTSTPRIQDAWVVNDGGLIVRALDYRTAGLIYSGAITNGTAYAAHFILPMTATNYLGFVDGASFIRNVNSTPVAPRTNVAVSDLKGEWTNYNKFLTNGENTMVNDAIVIDSSHVMMAISAPVDPSAAGSSKLAREATSKTNYLRIIKFVESNFVDVSPQTKTYTSVELGVALCPDQQNWFHKVDTNCYVFLSKSDTTEGNMQVTIKAIRAA